MLTKTDGIILRQIKYNDKSNIVNIFTKDFGKKSFIVYGINSQKKGKFLRNILQPLNLVSIEFYHKQTNTLAKIKEISLAYPYKTVPIDFYKKTILLFLSEILNKVLYENLEDKNLFDFIWNSLILFDLQQENYANFHLMFLISLTQHLGIKPINNFSEKNRFFNIQEGQFTPQFNPAISLDQQISKLLSFLLNVSISDFEKIKISRSDRQQILEALIKYFSFHIESFGNVNSYEILKEIFDA